MAVWSAIVPRGYVDGACDLSATPILDGNGRQTQLIDDRGDITLFEYDTLDREVKMIFHDGSTRSSVYDEAGDVTGFTDENGSLFANTFDALGRKRTVNITVAGGAGVSNATTSQSFEYDGLSRMTDAQNNGSAGMSEVKLVYDSLGRVLEDAQTFGGHPRYVTNTAFTSYPATQFTFPSGRAIDNAYDLLYRCRSVVEDSGSANIASSQFFGPSRVAEVLLGNGLVCTWMNNARTNSAVQSGVPGVPNPAWVAAPDGQASDRLGYDGSDRMITKRYLVSGLSGSAYAHTSAVVGFTTEYDRASNKFFERALHAENRSHLYEPFVSQVPKGGYDSLDRLLQYQRGTLDPSGGSGGNGGGDVTSPITVSGTDSVRSYVLDGLGNWRQTAFTPVSPPTAQTAVRQHNGLNQITRIQNGSAQTNPTYDKNGNLTFDGTLTYTWDALNRLADVTGGTGAYYVYDALNRRVGKTVGGTVTDCLYSGWQCVEDRDGSNNPSVQYIWGIYLDELIQQKNIATINGFGVNALLYPLQDLLYRTTGLADASSPPVMREAYDTDAYGNTLIFRNTGSPPAAITFNDTGTLDAQVSAPTCPFIFTGQRFDFESALYYYKRQYYSSALGRFLSRDPQLPKDAASSCYEYVRTRPTYGLDPAGLDSGSLTITDPGSVTGNPGPSKRTTACKLNGWNRNRRPTQCNYPATAMFEADFEVKKVQNRCVPQTILPSGGTPGPNVVRYSWPIDCVCKNMGDTPYSNCVRGCIKCVYDEGNAPPTTDEHAWCFQQCETSNYDLNKAALYLKLRTVILDCVQKQGTAIEGTGAPAGPPPEPVGPCPMYCAPGRA